MSIALLQLARFWPVYESRQCKYYGVYKFSFMETSHKSTIAMINLRGASTKLNSSNQPVQLTSFLLFVFLSTFPTLLLYNKSR